MATNRPEVPRRRVEAVLRVGADDWDGIERALQAALFRLAERADRGEQRIDVTSGGPDYGSVFLANVDPEVTHDSYFAASERWLTDTRALTGTPEGGTEP